MGTKNEGGSQKSPPIPSIPSWKCLDAFRQRKRVELALCAFTQQRLIEGLEKPSRSSQIWGAESNRKCSHPQKGPPCSYYTDQVCEEYPRWGKNHRKGTGSVLASLRLGILSVSGTQSWKFLIQGNRDTHLILLWWWVNQPTAKRRCQAKLQRHRWKIRPFLMWLTDQRPRNISEHTCARLYTEMNIQNPAKWNLMWL